MTVNDAFGLAFDAIWGADADTRETARRVLSDAFEEAGEQEKATLARQEHNVYYITGKYELLIEEFSNHRGAGEDVEDAIDTMIEVRTYSSPAEAEAFMDAMAVHDGWSEVYSSATLDDIQEHVRSIVSDSDEEDVDEDNADDLMNINDQ